MIVRELITRLASQVDMTGAKQYDAALQRIQQRVNGVAKSLGSLPRTITVKVNQVGGGGWRRWWWRRRRRRRRWRRSAFTRGGLGLLNRIGELAENMEELGEAAFMVGMAILAIPLAGDRMLQNIGAINKEIGDSQLAEEIYEKIYQSVRRTGAGINETARAFGDYNDVIEDAGGNTDDTISLMTGLQVAMASANMTAKDMNAVMDRVGKSLEEGKFNKTNFAALLDVPGMQEHLQAAFKVDSDRTAQAADGQQVRHEAATGADTRVRPPARHQQSPAALFAGVARLRHHDRAAGRRN